MVRPVTVYFADSSALARLYLETEPDAQALDVLLNGPESTVMASELADVEVPKALATALRHGRIDAAGFLARLNEYQTAATDEGPVLLIGLDPPTIVPRARELVLDHDVRTLDALHLAVAETAGRALAEDEDLVFVTRDAQQRAVAEALGMATA